MEPITVSHRETAFSTYHMCSVLVVAVVIDGFLSQSCYISSCSSKAVGLADETAI